jgi:hypothetical protein
MNDEYEQVEDNPISNEIIESAKTEIADLHPISNTEFNVAFPYIGWVVTLLW